MSLPSSAFGTFSRREKEKRATALSGGYSLLSSRVQRATVRASVPGAKKRRHKGAV
jgi:hypothetical protein